MGPQIKPISMPIMSPIRQPEELIVLTTINLTNNRLKLPSICTIGNARQKYYSKNKNKEVAAFHTHYLCNAKAILRRARKYYAENRARLCSNRRRC